MGRRGPVPEPTTLKLLRGNPGKRSLNRREPQPRTDEPACPDWINHEAKMKHSELVVELGAVGILTRIDSDALTTYCQAWARWKLTEQFIQTHDPVVAIKNKDGSLKSLQEIPHVARASDLLRILNRFQQEFGMTPSARSRIEVPEGRAVDEYERFLKGKSG